MQLIYQLLKQRLQEIAALQEVAWHTGQFEQNGEQSLYVEQGAYIEFYPAEWQQLGNEVQEAVLEFEVFNVTACLANDDNRFLDPAIGHLETGSAIYKKLQGWTANLGLLPAYSASPIAGTMIINSIVRVSSNTDHSLSGLIVSSQRFQCTVYDIEAHPTFTAVNAALLIDIQKTSSI